MPVLPRHVLEGQTEPTCAPPLYTCGPPEWACAPSGVEFLVCAFGVKTTLKLMKKFLAFVPEKSLLSFPLVLEFMTHVAILHQKVQNFAT